LFSSILNTIRHRRSRKRITQQFISQGFTEIDRPLISDMLPLRYPEIVRDEDVCLFAREDMQMLVVPTLFLPRTRLPHRGRTFVLLCTPLEDSPLTRGVSAALRDPAEQFSIVDQLTLDTCLGLSPIPYSVLLASDERSARAILQVVGINKKQSGSIILHANRLLAQVSA